MADEYDNHRRGLQHGRIHYLCDNIPRDANFSDINVSIKKIYKQTIKGFY